MNVDREVSILGLPEQPPILDPESPAAPAAYLDYDPVGYQIFPCNSCASWWAEVVRRDDGLQVVREWHHPRCRFLIQSR